MYMSPEILYGVTNLTEKSADIWSLGIFLFELLTFTKPFTAKDLKNHNLLQFKQRIP